MTISFAPPVRLESRRHGCSSWPEFHIESLHISHGGSPNSLPPLLVPTGRGLTRPTEGGLTRRRPHPSRKHSSKIARRASEVSTTSSAGPSRQVSSEGALRPPPARLFMGTFREGPLTARTRFLRLTPNESGLHGRISAPNSSKIARSASEASNTSREGPSRQVSSEGALDEPPQQTQRIARPKRRGGQAARTAKGPPR